MSINAWIGIFVQRWISEKIEIFSTLMMINELYWYVYISILIDYMLYFTMTYNIKSYSAIATT